MSAFTDNAGRTWTISVTFGSIKRVKELLSVNLARLEDGDPPLLTQLGTDVVLLCDVIYCLIKPQADQQDVSDEQWAAAMGGEAILSAHNAFYEALQDFSRSAGRPDVVKAARKQKVMIELAVKAGEQRLDGIDPEAEIESIYGDSDTSSPPSAE
jgi:hypothetical protein